MKPFDILPDTYGAFWSHPGYGLKAILKTTMAILGLTGSAIAFVFLIVLLTRHNGPGTYSVTGAAALMSDVAPGETKVVAVIVEGRRGTAVITRGSLTITFPE